MDIVNIIIRLYGAAVIDCKDIENPENPLLVLKHFHKVLKNKFGDPELTTEPLVPLNGDKPHDLLGHYLNIVYNVIVDHSIPTNMEILNHTYITDSKLTLNQTVTRNIDAVLSSVDGSVDIIKYEDCAFDNFRAVTNEVVEELRQYQRSFRTYGGVVLDILDSISENP